MASAVDATWEGGPAAATTGVRISMGALLVVAAAVAGTALRLVGAGWLPLDQAESALALPPWRAANGLPDATVYGSPLLYHLERLVFEMVAGAEPAARFVPAVAGVLLVIAVWRMRPLLGATTALAAAAIVGLSPLWVFLGRDVGAATLIALFLAGVAAAWPVPGRAAGWAVAALSALVIAAGGPGLTLCVAAALALVAVVARGGTASLTEAVLERWPTTSARREAAAVFAVTLVLSATGLMTRADGIAALVQQPARWLEGLAWTSGPAVDGFVLPIVAYAPTLLVFGCAGMALSLRAGSRFERLIATWCAVALITGVLFGTPATVAEAALPLAIMAAVAVARLASSVAAEARWAEEGVMTGITVLVLCYAGMQLLRYAQAESGAEGTGAATVALGALLMAAVLLGVFALLWGPDVAVRVAGLVALLTLPLLAWSNGTWLNYRAPSLLREAMRPEYVATGASHLADTAAGASWARTRDPYAWSIVAEPDLRPDLAWQLRRHDVRWAAAEGRLEEALVVVGAGRDAAFGPSDYRGQAYAVGGRWTPAFGGPHGFVRWWLQRRPAAGASQPDMTWAELFVRSQ